MCLDQEIDGEAMSALTDDDIEDLLSQRNPDGSKLSCKIGIKRKFQTKLTQWKAQVDEPKSVISAEPKSVISTEPKSVISTEPKSVISTEPKPVISTELKSGRFVAFYYFTNKVALE